MSAPGVGYRDSHTAPGYGRRYNRTYAHGYYAEQWRRLERPLVERLFAELRRRGSESYLDFACGTGRITAVGAGYFRPTVGVDVSEAMLAEAPDPGDGATLLLRDITEVPLGRRFDVVTAFRFFVNAETELRRKALRAIRAHLEDGGTLVLNVHVNRSSVLGVVYRARNRLLGREVNRVLGHAEMAALLNEAGFEIVRTYWYGFLPRTGWYFPWLSQHCMAPVEWACGLLPFVPRSLAQSFIVVCRKAPARR